VVDVDSIEMIERGLQFNRLSPKVRDWEFSIQEKSCDGSWWNVENFWQWGLNGEVLQAIVWWGATD
jgi:hypothetical protein